MFDLLIVEGVVRNDRCEGIVGIEEVGCAGVSRDVS